MADMTTRTPEERARELASHWIAVAGAYGEIPSNFDVYPAIDSLTAAIAAALRAEYERGQRDMRERAQLAAEGYNAACNSKEMEPFVLGRLIEEIYARDIGIGRAIAALPITPDSGPCKHEWVNAVNEAVSGGVVCIKCHAVRATPDSEKEGGE